MSVSDNNNFIMLQHNIRLSGATMVVTGGAGFIGSNLCEHLLETGHTVRCLDNFATGHIENILPLFEKHPGRFSLLVGDIRNMEDCRKAVDGMEYVLHEAALGSVPRSIKDPITTNAVNQIYNTAYGERTTLNQLVAYLKEYLSEYDPAIAAVEPVHGPNRAGDIPHSLADVDKAKRLLGYDPQFSMRQGLKEAVKWYWNNL